MTKFSLSYLAGALTVGVAVFLNGGRGTLIAFALGVLTVAAILVASLASVRRLRRAARFLIAFAAGLESRLDELESTRVAAPEPQPEGIEAEVASALQNLKTPKKTAAAAARRAVEQLHGEQSFEPVFRLALSLAKGA